MMEYYVVFSSITHAIRVEKHAKASGVRCTIVRTPNELKIGGCGYSLKTKEKEDGWRVLNVSMEIGTKNLGLFSLTSSGETVKLS